MDHQSFAQLLGNYGEFVGAIAVVVTLFYLAVQIKHSSELMKQNIRQMEVMALNQHDELVGAWRMNLYSNELISELWIKGSLPDTEFNELDAFRFQNLVVDFFQRSRTSFVAAKAAGHTGQMEMTARNVAARLAFSTGVRAIWERAGRGFSELVEPDFVRYIEEALKEMTASEAFRGDTDYASRGSY